MKTITETMYTFGLCQLTCLLDGTIYQVGRYKDVSFVFVNLFERHWTLLGIPEYIDVYVFIDITGGQ